MSAVRYETLLKALDTFSEERKLHTHYINVPFDQHDLKEIFERARKLERVTPEEPFV
jgi:hypothetical protein